MTARKNYAILFKNMGGWRYGQTVQGVRGHPAGHLRRFKQLMAQKPLERITVAEIMESCGMRRQHFYYYFTDIYDLLR